MLPNVHRSSDWVAGSCRCCFYRSLCCVLVFVQITYACRSIAFIETLASHAISDRVALMETRLYSVYVSCYSIYVDTYCDVYIFRFLFVEECVCVYASSHDYVTLKWCCSVFARCGGKSWLSARPEHAPRLQPIQPTTVPSSPPLRHKSHRPHRPRRRKSINTTIRYGL